ncbi:LiaG family protein [Neobacillus drentensis]|uniref:LiaG family protein n=1 Tax=Neobacillus drentensis TaxID=220684 RepID=UPI003B58A449
MGKVKRIIFLLLVITGLYILYNQVSTFDWFSKTNNNSTQSAMTEDIDVIEVDISSVSATIIPEDRKDVKAIYNGKDKLTVREHGDTIEVSVKHKGFGWFDWSPFSKKKKLKIYIPEDYHRKMSISLGSGNVIFSGQSKSNPLKLDELKVDIGSGNMDLKNMMINKFEQNVASGNVDIKSLQTKTGSFDVSSGSLDVKEYTGAIQANVSSGEIDFQVDQLTDSIDIEVSSGDVKLDLPNNADFTLDGDVASGDIICELPLTSKNIKKRSIEGIHGSGKYKIDLDVSSGDIRIR